MIEKFCINRIFYNVNKLGQQEKNKQLNVLIEYFIM